MINKKDQLAKACKDLMLKEPFYGLFLIMLNKEWTKTRVPTAGVWLSGINYNLTINEDFWAQLPEAHRTGLLKHELLHIAFFHLTGFSHLGDKRLANIAMDLEINQYIDRATLPEDGMFLELFPELNLEPKKGTQYYYDKLTEAAKKGSCSNLNKILEADKNGQVAVKVTINDKGEIEVKLPDHGTWEDSGAEPNEAQKKLMENQLKHILNEIKDQVEKSRGTVPGEMVAIIQKINHQEPPKFDWRGYLRRFAGGSVKVYTKKTRRKYNKRYEDNPGLKIKQKKHILVAIDTSGSVSNDELKEFMQEINHIHKTGAEVTIAHADTAIKKIHSYNPRDKYEIYGRGGTDFDPVIEYYNANTRKYSCLIYMTDGEAPEPVKPKGRVLWTLSSTSNKCDHLPGVTIKLN
jgi:predicted metal-dependent peptidase